MIGQRQPNAAPVLCAAAEALPLLDHCVDAALAILTLHHWSAIERGIDELKRVARRRLVLVTWDPEAPDFWLADYFPELVEIDRQIFPTLGSFASGLQRLRAMPLPIPADCSDGFLGAYWRRPECYLDETVRSSISTFARLDDIGPGLRRLREDLHSGRWDDRHGDLRRLEEHDVGYRILVAEL